MATQGVQVIKREVKLETMLDRLIERDGYGRNRQPILDSIHVTAAALSQYVRGRTRPSFDKLLALAEFFEVSLDYLVYGELTSTPTDPAPYARYVQQALTEERVRANRHTELVARVSGLLMDLVNDAANTLEERVATFEGLIATKDILRVERHCTRADVVTADLATDVILVENGDAVAGEFFPVVIENLSRDCTYRFLLIGELTTQSPAVIHFRKMLTEAVGGDRLHEYCFFRTATSPVPSAPVVYELAVPKLRKAEPAIFAQVSKYLLDETWLGYLNRPVSESNADMLMTPSHVARTREVFESLWATAMT